MRKLLQQALDALEGLFGVPDHMMGGGGGVAVWRLGGSAPVRDAIEALKAELAKQEQSITTTDEDSMFTQIEDWASMSFKRHRQSVKGQQITRADSPESHIVWAAFRWIKEHPTEPNCKFPTCHSQEYQDKLVQEILDEPIGWATVAQLKRGAFIVGAKPSYMDNLIPLYTKGTP